MNLNFPIDQIPENEFAYLQNVRSYIDGRLQNRPGLDLVGDNFTAGTNVHSLYTLNDSNPDTTGTSRRFAGAGTDLWWSDITFPAPFSAIAVGYSGNPLSFVAFSPEGNPTPFIYVYDSFQQRKYSASYLLGGGPVGYQIGIPQSAMYAAGPPVPVVTGPGNLDGDYQWRWQLRNNSAGGKSTPGVATWSPLTLTTELATFNDPNIIIHGIPAIDSQYYWDLYRSGGAISAWTWVGSVQNTSGNTIVDNNADVDIASNPTLDVSPEAVLYQPWLSPDIPRTGSVTATLAAVSTASGVGGDGSLVTGTGFNINWIPGTALTICGRAATVARVISTSNLFVNEDFEGDIGPGDWSEVGALESGYPLPYAWGPFGSGIFGLYVFGCGNVRAAGTLYWCNGNDPDSVSLTGSLEITDVSEPLQNGCVWNGRVYCWSSERMWEITPDLATPGQFVAQVVPGAKGLPYNWCFTVGDFIYWLSKDGIYRFSGSIPDSMSDHQLNQLLGHDGNQGESVFIPDPDNPGSSIECTPPDPNKPAQLRMNWHQGVLHLDYADTDNICQTYTYDSHIVKGWVRDTYIRNGYRVHFSENGFNELLIGVGPNLFQCTGDTDEGADIAIRIMTRADLLGDLRGQKIIGDAVVGAVSNGLSDITAMVLGNRNVSILGTNTLTASGLYQQTTINVDFAPVDTGTNSLSRTAGLWISADTAVAVQFFDWEVSYVPKTDITSKRATDWTDDGEPGDKFVYGCLIEANTFGAARTIAIYGDDNTLITTLTVNHAIQSTQPYHFTPPLITHQMRAVPTDENTWELFKIVWKWLPKPELTQFTQDWTDDGDPVPKYLQGFVLEADTLGQNVSIALWADGQLVQTFTANHDGQLEKPYAVTSPPIIHEMRLIPSGNDIRYLPPFKIAWVYTKQPEFTHFVEDFTGTDPTYYRGVAIECDTQGATIAVQVITEDGLQRTLSVTHNGRSQKAYSFLEPFIATEIKLVPQGDWRHYTTRWIGNPRPDLAPLYTDYTDDGYEGSKFFQGFTLWADTLGQDITLTIQFDGDQVGGVFTKVNHNGNLQIEYSFPTPFTAHQVRVIPSNTLRYEGPWKMKWIWETAPDLAKNWITQTTSHGLRGYHHHRDAYIALQSYDTVLLRVVMDDGNTYNYLIDSTGGEIRKPYEILQPMKGKLSQYSLISCKPFRVWQNDCEVRAKEWGSTAEFQIFRPFGGVHFDRGGARI